MHDLTIHGCVAGIVALPPAASFAAFTLRLQNSWYASVADAYFPALISCVICFVMAVSFTESAARCCVSSLFSGDKLNSEPPSIFQPSAAFFTTSVNGGTCKCGVLPQYIQ